MKRAEVRARVDRSVGEHHIARSFGFITADDVESVVAAARRTSLRLFDGRARRLRHMDRSGGRGWQRRLGGQRARGRALRRRDAFRLLRFWGSSTRRRGPGLRGAEMLRRDVFQIERARQAEGRAPRGRCSRLAPAPLRRPLPALAASIATRRSVAARSVVCATTRRTSSIEASARVRRPSPFAGDSGAGAARDPARRLRRRRRVSLVDPRRIAANAVANLSLRP